MSFSNLLNQTAHFQNLVWIKSACRLIKNKNFRISHKSMGKTNALPVSAAKLSNIFVHDFFQSTDFGKFPAFFRRILIFNFSNIF